MLPWGNATDSLFARPTHDSAHMENLRAAGQALAISLVVVLALMALWNFAPILLAGVAEFRV